jgi:hypothetical protein
MPILAKKERFGRFVLFLRSPHCQKSTFLDVSIYGPNATTRHHSETTQAGKNNALG